MWWSVCVCVWRFRGNWLFAHSGRECTRRPLLWDLMVQLIEIEAICQNASAYSHCFMHDLRLYLQDVLRLMYTHSATKTNLFEKFQWGISPRFRETLKEKPQRDKQCSRQHPSLVYPLSFISSTVAPSTFQTHTFWMHSLLGNISYFYCTQSSDYIGGSLGKLLPRIWYTC